MRAEWIAILKIFSNRYVREPRGPLVERFTYAYSPCGLRDPGGVKDRLVGRTVVDWAESREGRP